MAQLKNLVDRGSFVREVVDFPVGIVDDGVQGFAIEGKKYVRTKRGRKFKSEEIGIWANGADMTAKLQSRINHADVRIIELDADGGDILINGTVTIPAGKSLRIHHGTRITGTGTLVNAKIYAGLYPIFSSTITLTNAESLIGYFPPEWFGAVGDNSNDDTASFQACFNSAVRNNGGFIKLSHNKTYKISSVNIPNFKQGYIPLLIVEGNGANIQVSGGSFGFVKTVSNQVDAGQEINSRIIFSNIRFTGTGAAGSGAIRMSPTYGSRIMHCNFNLFDTALDLRFCLNAYVGWCFFQGNNLYDIIAAEGDWSGASGNNSQTNQTKFENNRHFAKLGQLACMRILKSSGIVVEDAIFEGANPVRNIEFDATGSTTVQHFEVHRPHVENAPTECSIFIKMATGMVEVSAYWAQIPHLAIDIDETTNANIILSKWQYFATGLKLGARTTGANGNGAWVFDNINFQAVSNPTNFFTNLFLDDATHKVPTRKTWRSTEGYVSSIYTPGGVQCDGLLRANGLSQFHGAAYHKSLTYLEGDTYLSSTKALFIGNTMGGTAQFIQGTSTYAQWYAGMRYVMRMHNDGKMTIGWGGTAAVDVDMSGARDAMLPPKLTADPSTSVEGMFYHNTTNKRLKHHNGSGWRDLADTDSAQTFTNKTLGSGTKVNLGTVAPGDMYYGDASGNLVRVPKGPTGHVWAVLSDTALGWVPAASGGGSPSGSGVDAIRTVTSNSTFTSADHTLLVDTSAGPVAIAVDVLAAGKDGWIKKISDDTNAVTITPVSGTIDGGASYVLDGYNEPVIMKSNGTNLYIFNK